MKEPEKCPVCGNILAWTTGDMHCRKCGHRQPHDHSENIRFGIPYACTCTTVTFQQPLQVLTGKSADDYWEKINNPKVTLNLAKEVVRELVEKQGFPNDKKALTQKLLWAFNELGEASDAYKKGEPWEKIFEELIDTIFYIVDFCGLVEKEYGVKVNLDKIFYEKWKKNMYERKEKYGQKRDIA